MSYEPHKTRHKNYVQYLEREGAKVKKQREIDREIAEQEGRTFALTRQEKQARALQEIRALEEKYGIDDYKPGKEQVVAYVGSTAISAINPNGTLTEIKG